MAILQIIGLSGENNSLESSKLPLSTCFKKAMSTSVYFSLVTTERNSCNLFFAYFTFTDNVKINKIYEAS